MMNQEKAITIRYKKNVHLLLAPSGGGKTFLLQYLLKGIPRRSIILFMPTFHDQKPEFREDFKGARLVEHSFKTFPYQKLRHKYLVFDDVGQDLHNSATFTKLIINKRHKRNAIFVLFQYINFVPTPVRSNFQYLYCFNFKSNDVKRIYDTWTNRFFPSVQAFSDYLDGLPEYGFLISNTLKYCGAVLNQ